MADYYKELLEYGVPKEIEPHGFTFEDVFDEHIASNQKTWKQDRRLTVGASECFGCIRKNWFTKRGAEFGYEPDDYYEENWGAMERGNIIENHFIVPAVEAGLRRRGLELIMAGEGQDTIIDGVHSATLDGLIIHPEKLPLPRDFLAYYGIEDIGEQDSIVLEMKSFDPRLTLEHEKPVHRGQTQMQMGLVREQTEYNPEYAVLVYINASWLSDIRVFVIEYDDSVYRIGRERNDKVFNVDDPGLFAAEGKLDGLCDYCPWQTACQNVTARRVPTSRKSLSKAEIEKQRPEFVDKLTPLVLERQRIAKELKAIQKRLEDFNERIRQALIEEGTSRAVGDNWKVTYTSQAGRRTISKALLEAAGINPEEYMQEGASFEKLTVTVKE